MFHTSLSCHNRIWLQCWIWEAILWQNPRLYAVQHIFVANFCEADLITTTCTPQLLGTNMVGFTGRSADCLNLTQVGCARQKTASRYYHWDTPSYYSKANNEHCNQSMLVPAARLPCSGTVAIYQHTA